MEDPNNTFIIFSRSITDLRDLFRKIKQVPRCFLAYADVTAKNAEEPHKKPSFLEVSFTFNASSDLKFKHLL